MLIVGAGPTGLALALELRRQGIPFRILDRAPDAVHESRALAIQARTLEVLDRLGVADELVAAGSTATTLVMHAGGHDRSLTLFEPSVADTRYPFLLFLSQAETERILTARLAAEGVEVERGVELVELRQGADETTCTVRTGTGERDIRARYVVGCDGAHSAVRHALGIGFAGAAIPRAFLLADVEAEGVDRGRLHFFVGAAGPLVLFPLGSPASFRLIVGAPRGMTEQQVTLERLQAVVDRYPRARLRLHDPVWLTMFTVHSRTAQRFRVRRVFLAGDAAHIHSPAGGQGMNTGIQDAVNLGWKLALVCNRQAGEPLLDTYEEERMPVARAVVAATHRAFALATSRSPLLRVVRPRVAGLAVATLRRSAPLRRRAFRMIGELDVRYRRRALTREGQPRLKRGPRAGDRLPDAPLRDGTLQRALPATAFAIVLAGPPGSWPQDGIAHEWGSLLETVHVDEVRDPAAHHRLGLRRGDVAHWVIRPDGYIGYRAGGDDVTGALAYLRSALR